jgi:hypothetical protein
MLKETFFVVAVTLILAPSNCRKVFSSIMFVNSGSTKAGIPRGCPLSKMNPGVFG